jgi:hypothetical protein
MKKFSQGSAWKKMSAFGSLHFLVFYLKLVFTNFLH